MIPVKVITFIIFLKTANCVFIHPFDDETYKTLLKLFNETDPATKRTNVEKDAVVKFWTSKGKFENIDNVVYYDGRKVKKIYFIYFSYIFLCIGYFAVKNIRLSLTKYNLAC